MVGAWDPATGRHLLTVHLHGPARYLVVEDGHLLVATELGDTERLDLGVLEQDYCSLLDWIWSQVPAVPGETGLVRAEPPDGHPCRR